MLHHIVPALAAMALMAGAAPAMEHGTPTVAPTTETTASIAQQDRAFITAAAANGRFEVESSQLALLKGLDEHHRTFAEQMVKDHQVANDQLAQIAQAKGVTLSSTLDERHTARLNALRTAEGSDFAATYHQSQKQAHDEAIALFERQSREGSDPELRRFAAETLATLRMHQQHLRMQGSQSGMSGSQGGISPAESGAWEDDARASREATDWSVQESDATELNTSEKGAEVQLQQRQDGQEGAAAKAPFDDLDDGRSGSSQGSGDWSNTNEKGAEMQLKQSGEHGAKAPFDQESSLGQEPVLNTSEKGAEMHLQRNEQETEETGAKAPFNERDSSSGK